MSDDEVESFEVTDHDLANEFNINRPRRKFSKHQQIYGVWADESSDEESRKRSSFQSEKKKPKDYTAPIGFVAGGVQQTGKKNEKKNKNEEDEDEGDNEQNRRLAGLSVSSSESEEEEERPTFGRKQEFEMTGDIAGMRKNRPPRDTTLIKKGVGTWERHTKGIGTKLLLQMGFEPGKGLGKSLQGINAPIVAKLRKGRGAIGAYGPEEAAKIAEIKSEEKSNEKVTEKLSRWRKEDQNVNQRVRYIYKSIEEVIEQGHGHSSSNVPDSSLARVKVIDMTGPEQRILSGYHAISRQQRPAAEWEVRKELKTSNFALPELQHNLNLLVDMCEQDIVSNARKYKYASDRIIALQYESTQLETSCKDEEKEMEKLETLVVNINSVVTDHQTGRMEMEKILTAFQRIKLLYRAEFQSYDLAELVTSLVTSLVKNSLSTWEPLKEPSTPLAIMVQWRNLVESEQSVQSSTLASPEPWGKLLWHAWIPTVRNHISTWNSRIPEPMLKFLAVWRTQIPPWVFQYILESLILPQITLHVEAWDAISDDIPIHVWIHPWLPLLNVHLQTSVFPIIRQTLSQALTAWHPSDTSAKCMLLSWDGVFSKGEMNAFLVRNIMPKLEEVMEEFVVDPQHQVLDKHWRWVMDWIDLMPITSMTTIFVKHFFTKWLQVLSIWLNHSPNYDQVSTWYLGWKSNFPESLLKQPEIRENFRQALDLMSRAANANGGPGAVESISYLKNLDRDVATSVSTGNSAATLRLQSMTEAVRMGSQRAVSFRSLFATRCEEKEIVFVPVHHKLYEGKQVYRCGNVLVYLDRNVVFVSNNSGSTWHPQSVSTALIMAEM